MKVPRQLFIGRWQPFHHGHEKIIREALKNGPVAIGVRDTEIDADNPYPADQRVRLIHGRFPVEDIEVFIMPDISSIHIGRGVGYEIVQHAEVPGVSGTELRKERFDASGMLLDKDGNRSIFDDVDQ